MTAARSIFDELTSTENITNLLIGRAEDDWLDFKTTRSGTGDPTRDDLDNFAKSLSAFANSDGGVLVWGVRCSSNGKEDVADEIIGVPRAEQFARKLATVVHSLTDPPVEKYEQAVIASDGEKYLIACLIPASEYGLHRAKREDLHTFFYRAGSRSLVMPTYLVAERFGRRPPARLEPIVTIVSSGGGSQGKTYAITFFIRNVGKVCAFHPAMRITFSRRPQSYGWPNTHNQPFQLRKSSIAERGSAFFVGVDEVIHPTSHLQVSEYDFTVPHSDEAFQDIQIEVEIYQDGPHHKTMFVVTADHLENSVNRLRLDPM